MSTIQLKSAPRLFVTVAIAFFVVAGCRCALDTTKSKIVINHDTEPVELQGESAEDLDRADYSTFQTDSEVEQSKMNPSDDASGASNLNQLVRSTGFSRKIPPEGGTTNLSLQHGQSTSSFQAVYEQSKNDEPDVAQVSYNTDGQEIRTLTLRDALKLAIENSEFIVDNASFLSPANPLLDDPQFLQSTYDLDLQRSSQQGIEAALANFDAQIASGFQWGRNSVLLGDSNFLSSDLLINENGTFYGRLDKPVASGATYSVIHNLNYANNTQTFPLDPRYNGFLRGEFRQPIFAGRGRTFTEIAGPNSYRSRQQGNGVALAEISERTAELEFRLGVERLLKQTEDLYWDYWLTREVHQYQQAAATNANEIWSRIRNRAETGLEGGGAADEAQAAENYYRRKAFADAALVEMEQASERLRHVTGLPEESSVVLVAVDSPFDLPIVFETESSVANGLRHRKELVKQDLQIQAIEYQLFASKQLNRPQLDLVSGVQLNGLGDDLFTEAGAFANLVDLDDIGWNVGFEFSMPLGFNREKLSIRYLRLLLNKAKTARKLQEKEIRHEISYTAKTVEKWNLSLTSANQRLEAAQRRLAAVDADFKAGRASLDLFLRSQDSVAQAQIEMARAVAELTKAQIDLLFRQGLTQFSRPDVGD